TVLSQVRVLPGPPPSPPLFVCAGEIPKRRPFVGTFGVSLLAETPDFGAFPRLCPKSLWRPISAPTASCWRWFESCPHLLQASLLSLVRVCCTPPRTPAL